VDMYRAVVTGQSWVFLSFFNAGLLKIDWVSHLSSDSYSGNLNKLTIENATTLNCNIRIKRPNNRACFRLLTDAITSNVRRQRKERTVINLESTGSVWFIYRLV
jgi:hypothetical protein